MNMLRRNRLIVAALVAVTVLMLGSCAAVLGVLFGSMDYLPKGEFVAAYDSPQGTYTLNIYLDGGGATTGFAIRGELVTAANGSRKNIYWSYPEQEATVEWVSDEVVDINGHVLDVVHDTYDWRRQ